MNITLPNGFEIEDVPEGITKEQVMQMAIQKGYAKQEDFAAPAIAPTQNAQPIQPAQQVSNSSEFTPSTPEKLKNKKIKDVMHAPEFGGKWSIDSVFGGDAKAKFKTQLGGALTGNPEEIMGIIAKQFPEQIKSGEYQFGKSGDEIVIKVPSGIYAMNPKGLGVSDLVRFGVDVSALSPAGGIVGTSAKQMGKGMIVAGGTQALMQGAEAGLGGDFNTEDVVLEAAFQGGFQAVAPLVKPLYGALQKKASTFSTAFKKAFESKKEVDAVKSIGKSISDKKVKPLIEKIMADKDVIAAAQDLGIVVNPSTYSTNEMYKQLETALKAMPESKLSVLEKQNIQELGVIADDLIKEYSGVSDLSELSIDFSERMLNTVKDMEDSANDIYNILDEHIPKTLKITPNNAIEYLEKHIENMGGMDEISSKLKGVYKSLMNENGVTWGKAEQIRKDLGSAFQNAGVFKDESQNIMKGLYHALRDDGLNVAEGMEKMLEATTGQSLPLGNMALEGKKIVAERKALEESLQGALGKDLGKSLMVELGGGVRGLQKGETKKFAQVMAAVPDDEKSNVAVAALNYVFQNSNKSKDFGITSFVSSYEALMRNKAASEDLMKHIPDEAKKKMKSMYLVSKGIVEANKKSLANPSGTAAQVVGAMNSPSGVFAKLFSVGGQMGAGAAATAPFDAGVTGAATGFLNAMKSGKNKTTESATEMLTSPTFQRAVNAYIGGNKEAADQILSSMSSTKKWFNSLPAATKRTILKQGLISYLFANEDK